MRHAPLGGFPKTLPNDGHKQSVQPPSGTLVILNAFFSEDIENKLLPLASHVNDNFGPTPEPDPLRAVKRWPPEHRTTELAGRAKVCEGDSSLNYSKLRTLSNSRPRFLSAGPCGRPSALEPALRDLGYDGTWGRRSLMDACFISLCCCLRACTSSMAQKALCAVALSFR